VREPEKETATLIFTGKGGVGKTTVAAATAVHLADRGVRTLVISTDPAHSLGDCLQIPLGSGPREVAENLVAMELDTREEMALRFGGVREVLMKQMSRQGVTTALAEEIVNFPGADELFGLLKLAEVKTSGEFDAVVVDTAPTGNTLRFLHFPEFLSPVRRALAIDRAYTKTVRPLLSVLGREVPKDDFFASIFALFDNIERARQEFLRGDTYFRFVLVPEKLAVVETQRAVSFLNVSGYTVDAVIANKVLPPDVSEPLFKNWQELQETYLSQTRQTFHPLGIFEVPLYDDEVLGLPMLRRVADTLYPDVDPLHRLARDDLFGLERVGTDVMVMRVLVPVLDESDVQLYKEGAVLTIEMGGYRRQLYCPETLVSREVLGAEREGNILAIKFGARDTAKPVDRE
jgi:arsenite/tail-anchored protein-transporting ATPase